MLPDAKELALALQMQPHPNGAGWVKETHVDEVKLPHEHLPPAYKNTTDHDPRPLQSAILQILPASEIIPLHQVRSDETLHYHFGHFSLTIYEFDLDTKEVYVSQLGWQCLKGEQIQHTIKKGRVWGALTNGNEGYVLIGETLSPGFDQRDFRLFSKAEMLSQFPQYEKVIEKLAIN